jgi:hypothetical protein
MMVRAGVDCGLTKTAAARKFNTTPKRVAKWIARFEAEGVGPNVRPAQDG